MAVAGVWALSRTAGLPLGPEAGDPEALAFIDVLSTAFELLTAVAVGLILRPPLAARRLARRTALAATLAAVVIVITLTAASLISSDGDHGPNEQHHMAAAVHTQT